jgi:hypothetical protein
MFSVPPAIQSQDLQAVPGLSDKQKARKFSPINVPYGCLFDPKVNFAFWSHIFYNTVPPQQNERRSCVRSFTNLMAQKTDAILRNYSH